MVSTTQLFALGVDKSGIERRVRAGALRRYMRSVYQVGPYLPHFGPEAAALLACPGAVLSHRSAAFVLELAPRPKEVHVITPKQRRGRPGLQTHRAQLAPHEIWDGQGLSLTAPFRTLTDLRNTPVFEHAVWEASFQRLITDEQARELLNRRPPRANHPGERTLVDLLLQAGLPEPQTNVRIGRFEVDLYWPQHKVAVELDGKKSHGHGLAQERDERKAAALAHRGVDLVRVTGKHLDAQPLEAVATIITALAKAA